MYMKTCSNPNCLELNPQPLICFSKNKSKKDGLNYQCKKCVNFYNADHYSKNKNKISLNKKGTQREYKLKKKFGLSLDDRNKMLISQEGRCAICKITLQEHFEEYQHDFAVDHDHLSGKNRGLLCTKCNTGLGLFQDNSILLKKAADYLDFFK